MVRPPYHLMSCGHRGGMGGRMDERPVVRSDLKEGALGLTGATMQAITHIAPAIAALFFTQFIVSLAGITAPLAYVVGVVVVLMLGNTLVQLSKHLPSAGGYYTYVSRALSPRAGFLTSWMYVLYSPLSGGPIYGFFGFILSEELKANYDVNLPWLWWAFVLVGAPFTAFLQHRGIELSARALLVLGGAEILIVLALAISGFANPGPGGFSLSVFDFGNKLALSGFTLAIVLSVQGLTGWEAAAPLAEETKDPRRNVPRSVMLSITILGIFLVLKFWGVVSGFGVDDVDSLINSEELPGLSLAHESGVVGGLLFGADVSFFFIDGLILVLGVAFVYVMANAAVGRYYLGERRSEFNPLLHLVFPIVSSAVLLYAIAVSFQPFCSTVCPASPFKWAPLVDGVWLLLGVGVLAYYRARGREDWVRRAGAALGESEAELERTVGYP